MDKDDIIKYLNEIIDGGVEGLAKKGVNTGQVAIRKIPSKAQQKLDDMCNVMALPVEYKKNVCSDKNKLTSAEIISINALVAFCAYNTGLTPLFVRLCVQTYFNVEKIDSIHARHYPDVVEFLVDYDITKFVN